MSTYTATCRRRRRRIRRQRRPPKRRRARAPRRCRCFATLPDEKQCYASEGWHTTVYPSALSILVAAHLTACMRSWTCRTHTQHQHLSLNPGAPRATPQEADGATTKPTRAAKAGTSGIYKVTCRDNGQGMHHKDIPNMLGRVLSGTKYGVKQTRGKFGLGAKMALLWCAISPPSLLRSQPFPYPASCF
jgi:hypothetical protein